ncbi:MAG TPA: hypothetical protein VF375_04905 [Candidatus Limnocylindrales bacterium]
MTTLPPDWRVATSAPPWADGKTTFGVWPVPGPTGWLALALAVEPVTRDIEGKIDGQTVLYCPMPRDPVLTTTSVPWPVAGHEVVVYAETLGPGRPVRCDVFVDGRSLTTGEPMGAISQRARAVAGKGPLVTAASLIWMIPCMSLFWVIRLPSYGGSGLALVAVIGAFVMDFGVAAVAYLALNRLVKLGYTGRRGLAAAAVIYVATFAAVMLVYGGALAIVRG